MYNKSILIAAVILLISSGLFAQTRPASNYSSEFIYGVNKNTNGGLIGGLIFRYNRLKSDKLIESFGLELSNVKHPKEVRYTTFIGNAYIWGKQNYLYSIRPHYGAEYLLFRKAQRQGVQVSVLGAAGPTLGLVSPYYIEYATGPTSSVRVPFDPEIHANQNNILGNGGLLRGLGESQLKIGAHAKAGVNFEFGTFRSNITGIEAGLMVEGFREDIIIIPTAENRNFFSSAYVSLYFGRRK
jgi:hypothetical protein